MRRSEINTLILQARKFFDEHHFILPEWADWSEQEWKQNKELATYLFQHQMGWDVTDFSSNDFNRRGLVLFCLRNGIPNQHHEKTYAEKIMMVRENQETPLHYHKNKMEDIIVRGGGELVFEMYSVDDQGKKLEKKVEFYRDGIKETVAPGAPVHLKPGQSMTLTHRLMHRFYGAKGKGAVLVGEVSQVNDDNSDNYFYEPLGRFSDIIEDEAPQRFLWNDLKGIKP